MSESIDRARAVWDVLNELRRVVHADDMRENGGFQADPHELQLIWKRFEEALREAADSIHHPPPGQGLMSIWLRAVCQRAARLEKAVREYHGGWHDVLWHDNESLYWLVIDGWHLHYQVLKLRGPAQPIASLLGPAVRPLDELRQLADEWTAEFKDAPRELTGLVREEIWWQWKPWNDKRDEYLARTGRLILQAVDANDIGREWYHNDGFCVDTLRYLSVPAGLARSCLSEISGDGLRKLVESLEPTGDAGTDTNAPKKEESDPYPAPHNYARDRWIYENIVAYDWHSLSLELKNRAPRDKWIVITSRNGLKKAADRYAIYHNLAKRRFRDE